MASFLLAAHPVLVISYCLVALLHLISSSPQPSTTCFPPDRAALEACAASFNSTLTPFFRTHWKPHLDCCSWEGVACTTPALQNYSRVSGLSLANRRLQGLFPPALCRLSALSALDLSSSLADIESGNYALLHGPIPSCIGHNLTSLQRLILPYNTFDGPIPQSFSRLIRLQVLDLSSNNLLSGSISPIFANLSQLTHLDLSGNDFNGTTLPFFNTPRLQYLDLARASFSGSIDSPRIANLSLLTHLDLSWNGFIGSTVPIFFNTPRLQYLDLSQASFSGSISPSILNLSQITHLDLSRNFINGTLPLFKTPKLQYLDLSRNCHLSGALLPAIIHSPSLQLLDVSGCCEGVLAGLAGPIPSFNTTPELRYLNLSCNQWEGDIPSLPHLQHLEELYLDETSISAQGSSISQLFCDLISLTALSIAGISVNYHSQPNMMLDSKQGAASGTLDYQLRPCEKPFAVNLTYLDLSNNKLMGPFPPWIGLFFNLQHLDLSHNNFSGSIPQAAWQNLSQLTFLQLSSNSSSPDPTRFQQLQLAWLFRLPLETLTLRSFGLTSQEFQCESRLSLLNQTLQALDLSENQLSDGLSLWHCFAYHNFTSLSEVYLAYNPLAFNLTRFPPFSKPFEFLDLRSCQLFGTLTMELLSSVGAGGLLYLAHNDLSGRIPDGRPNPSPLQLGWLDVSFNNLTGTLPAWLGEMPNLEGLVLNNNHLGGEISAEALNGTLLFVLLLGNNHFSKATFHNITSYGTKILDLSFNKLGGDLQELLGGFRGLTALSVLLLNHNQLTGSIPTFLGLLAQFLVVIDLSFNHLTGAIPESLGQLNALQADEISPVNYNPLLQHAFELQSLKSVRISETSLLGYLDLSSNLLNGSIPTALGNLLWLNDLNLSRNQLTGHIPSSLGNLIRLESLDLSYNLLQGSIPATLSQIDNLAVFNVSFNPELSGQIPEGPQFEEEESYVGDPNLCGSQLRRPVCTTNITGATDKKLEHDADEGVNESGPLQWMEKWVSIPGLCIGYALGFGLIIWLLNRLKFYHLYIHTHSFTCLPSILYLL